MPTNREETAPAPDAERRAPNPEELRNFRVLLTQGTAVDVVRTVAGPQLVLPYLYVALGAPTVFAGLLIPFVQIGRLLSQLAAAPRIAATSTRKSYMVLGTAIMALALIAVAVTAVRVQGAVLLVFLFLGFAAVLGVGQGVSRLAFQTLLGGMLSRRRQNMLLLLQLAFSGILVVAMAAASEIGAGPGDAIAHHISLLWIGIAASGVSLILTFGIREPPEIQTGHRGGDVADRSGPEHQVVWHGLSLLREMRWFRQFCAFRCMLLSVELALPFYAIHVAAHHGQTRGTLHVLVIAYGIAMIVSGVVWQRQSDLPLRYAMSLAAIVAALGALVSVTIELIPGIGTYYGYAIVFFLVGLAMQGTGVARKVYLLAIAPPVDAPYYVSVSNVITGIVAIGFAFVLGAVAHLVHTMWPIVILMALNISTAAYALALPIEGKEEDRHERAG